MVKIAHSSNQALDEPDIKPTSRDEPHAAKRSQDQIIPFRVTGVVQGGNGSGYSVVGLVAEPGSVQPPVGPAAFSRGNVRAEPSQGSHFADIDKMVSSSAELKSLRCTDAEAGDYATRDGLARAIAAGLMGVSFTDRDNYLQNLLRLRTSSSGARHEQT